MGLSGQLAVFHGSVVVGELKNPLARRRRRLDEHLCGALALTKEKLLGEEVETHSHLHMVAARRQGRQGHCEIDRGLRYRRELDSEAVKDIAESIEGYGTDEASTPQRSTPEVQLCFDDCSE